MHSHTPTLALSILACCFNVDLLQSTQRYLISGSDSQEEILLEDGIFIDDVVIGSIETSSKRGRAPIITPALPSFSKEKKARSI